LLVRETGLEFVESGKRTQTETIRSPDFAGDYKPTPTNANRN